VTVIMHIQGTVYNPYAKLSPNEPMYTSISANTDRLRLTQNHQYHTTRQAKSPSSKCCKWYLKHIATWKTITSWLLAHTYMVRPKLYLVDLLSTYYTSKYATNTQETRNAWQSLAYSPHSVTP